MAVRIKVDVEAVRRQLNAVAKSSRGAIAAGLSRTAAKLAEDSPEYARVKIDRPRDFTLRGFRWQAASRDTMTAVVFVRERQDSYLRYLEAGGRRAPTPPFKSLPRSDEEDAYGNMPIEVRRLMRRQVQARSSKVLAERASKASARAAAREARRQAKMEARVDRRVQALLARNLRRRRPKALDERRLREEVRSALAASARRRAARAAERQKARAAAAQKRPKAPKQSYFIGQLRGGKRGGSALWQRTTNGRLRLIVSFNRTPSRYTPMLGLRARWKRQAQGLGPIMIQRAVADAILRAADAGPAQSGGSQRVRTR